MSSQTGLSIRGGCHSPSSSSSHMSGSTASGLMICSGASSSHPSGISVSGSGTDHLSSQESGFLASGSGYSSGSSSQSSGSKASGSSHISSGWKAGSKSFRRSPSTTVLPSKSTLKVLSFLTTA